MDAFGFMWTLTYTPLAAGLVGAGWFAFVVSRRLYLEAASHALDNLILPGDATGLTPQRCAPDFSIKRNTFPLELFLVSIAEIPCLHE